MLHPHDEIQTPLLVGQASALLKRPQSSTLLNVIGLTKQERFVLFVVAFLLVTGWVAKCYRATHPMVVKPGAVITQAGKP